MIDYQGEKFRLWLDDQFKKDKGKPSSDRFNMKKAIEMLGVSKTNMYQYFRSSNLKRETVSKILTTFNVSEEEIWGDDNKKVFKEEVTPVPHEHYMMVEYVDLAAEAGHLGTENVDMLPDTKKRLVPREFDRGNYLVVRVSGDSMDNGTAQSIPDGSEILVKEHVMDVGEKLPIRNNLFVVVSSDGSVFKQVVEHNIEEGYVRCRSYNKKYQDFKISTKDIFQIFIYRKVVSVRPPIPDISEIN